MHIDLHRFDRQIALPNIDLEGQEKLQRANVLIVGMGGLGCAASQAMVGMGVGTVTLVDFDKVETSNLARQPLYHAESIGMNKVDAALEALQPLNPRARIISKIMQFGEGSLKTLSESGNTFDLVLDCTDNAPTRLLINQQSVEQHVPLITAAAIRFEGMVMPVVNASHSPCYACLTKVWPVPDETCVERGVFGPVVSIIGCYQAMLAGQFLLGLSLPKPGTVQFFDGLNHQWQTLTIEPAQDCEVCKRTL